MGDNETKDGGGASSPARSDTSSVKQLPRIFRMGVQGTKDRGGASSSPAGPIQPSLPPDNTVHAFFALCILAFSLCIVAVYYATKDKHKRAVQWIFGAFLVNVVLFAYTLRKDDHASFFRVIVLLSNVVFAIFTIIVGVLKAKRSQKTIPFVQQIRVVEFLSYALIMIGGIVISTIPFFQLQSTQVSQQGVGKIMIIKTRIYRRFQCVLYLFMILGLCAWLILSGSKTRHEKRYLQTLLRAIILPAFAIVFVLGFNWVATAGAELLTGQGEEERTDIQDTVHTITMNLKLFGLGILLIMTIMNNSNQYRKHLAPVVGMAVAAIGIMAVAWYFNKLGSLSVGSKIVLIAVVAVFVSSLPTSPFVRHNPGIFAGIFSIICISAAVFVALLVWGTNNKWGDPDIKGMAAMIIIGAGLVYVALQTSGFLDASMDTVTPARFPTPSADCPGVLTGTTPPPNTKNGYNANEMHHIEKDAWQQVYLGVTSMIVFMFVLVFFIIMATSMSLINSHDQSKNIPLWLYAIAFSVLMNATYLVHYYFLNRWTGGENKVVFDFQFIIEFCMVILKFIIFFYILWASGVFRAVSDSPTMIREPAQQGV